MAPDQINITSPLLSLTVSALGAEMQSLQDARGQEWLWQGDPAYWSGRAPLLFPIVGRAPENRIAVGPHSAEMAQHGFARRTMFHLAQQAPDMCCFVLEDSAQTRAVYPFAFRLSVTYRLDGAALTTTVAVENRSATPMPFGFGFHPAFAWPLPGAAGRPHRVTLANGGAPAMARLRDGLLPPERLPSPFADGMLTLSEGLFDADAMIFPEGAGEALSYGVEAGPGLSFRFDNLPNLALWSKPGAAFLCVEPWHGMAAQSGAGPQIADRPFSTTLAPQAVARFGYSVTVQDAA